MKALYLTEGPHDSMFLTKILIRCNVCDEKKIDIFKNAGAMNAKRFAETRTIKRFMEPNSPYSILIKEENGKRSLLQLMNSICINAAIAMEPPPKLIVMFDHDNLAVTREFEQIRDLITSSKNKIDFIQISRTNHMGIAHSSVYKLVKSVGSNRKIISMVHFFCFFNSLERTAENLFGKHSIKILVDKMSEKFSAEDIFAVESQV